MEHALVEEFDQIRTTTRIAQASQGPFFDLADALARHLKDIGHFAQGVVITIPQTESQLENLAFTVAE